ncbi:MAG: outer membrane protein assembly factor BamB family protein [Planctomycetota bacterium]|jgi:outer membrane protein assembly factor BamB
MISSVVTRAGEYAKQAEQILDVTSVKGGLIVHIGCGDGKLTAALRANNGYLVHGLDADPDKVHQARRYIRSLGTYGNVAVDQFDGKWLPYADNLVNLVVAENLRDVPMSEVMRVLCPKGTAYIKEGGKWKRRTKLGPKEIDEWTHYLYDASGNAVSQDQVVGPPHHFQWISKPRFSRSHDHLASTSAVVSSGGRLFCIVDEGAIAFAAAGPKWRLVARDAFNGVRLWDREISRWEYHLRDFRSGPADIARRLVAARNRVYVTLGYGLPVVALDAATGETVRTYVGTEGTQEILYDDGTLLLVLGAPKKDWQAQKARQIVSQSGYSPPFETYTPPAHEMRLMAVDANTGELRWKNSQPYTRELMPSTLAASAGRVYFQNADAVICLDATTGQPQWKAPRRVHRTRLAWSTPTLVVHDDVVFSADRRAAETQGDILWIPSGGYHDYIRGEDVKGELIAFSAETGERLWSCPAYEGFNAPVDVMIADGLLWTGRYAWGNDPGMTEARDPKTGEVRRQRPSDQEFLPRIGHARCHRAKATANYLILGRRGVEFIDLETGDMVANFWVRGICQYGVMPANGLLYVPPHSCACSVNDILKCGFMALAPQRQKPEGRSQKSERLEKGPAYGHTPSSDLRPLSSDSWPTYRHDGSRSGVTSADVSHNLQLAWEMDLGGKLSSPVIAGGVLLVAETDAHSIHALDATSGRGRWAFVAAARIDSPPTIDRGRVLFGSADGWVYCLRLTDGELVWKFRAAPRSRQIVVDGQLESSWPISGSVLAVNGAAFFVAGRTSYLDGGMFLYKLDAASGYKLDVLQLEVEQKKRDGGIASGGHLPDILSSDGESIFLRSARFNLDLVRQKDDVAHLWSSVGFLDDNWWHRTYWQVGTSMASGWGGWAKAGQRVPAGRLLVIDAPRVFGFGRNQYDTPGAHVGIDADGVWGPIGRQQGRWTFYRLFRQTMGTQPGKDSRRELEKQAAIKPDWTRGVPMVVQAMVLADETLFVAGPSVTVEVNNIPRQPTDADPFAEALEARRGGSLLAVSANNGQALADYDLKSPPVFDGMAAANGRLYISSADGGIVCMSPSQ